MKAWTFALLVAVALVGGCTQSPQPPSGPESKTSVADYPQTSRGVLQALFDTINEKPLDACVKEVRNYLDCVSEKYTEEYTTVATQKFCEKVRPLTDIYDRPIPNPFRGARTISEGIPDPKRLDQIRTYGDVNAQRIEADELVQYVNGLGKTCDEHIVKISGKWKVWCSISDSGRCPPLGLEP